MLPTGCPGRGVYSVGEIRLFLAQLIAWRDAIGRVVRRVDLQGVELPLEHLPAVGRVVDRVILLQADRVRHTAATAGRKSGGTCSSRPARPGPAAPTRARISSAALLVNVRATICRAGTPCASKLAMRCVITRVLPLPGPARINSGPARCSTAARWAGVRDSKRCSFTSGAILGCGRWASEQTVPGMNPFQWSETLSAIEVYEPLAGRRGGRDRPCYAVRAGDSVLARKISCEMVHKSALPGILASHWQPRTCRQVRGAQESTARHTDSVFREGTR